MPNNVPLKRDVRFKIARLNKEISQLELARLVGVAEHYISK